MKRNILIKAGYVVIFLLVAIQFFPVQRNEGNAETPDDIIQATAPPAEVATLLKRACYDCHSDHTEYPWYARIQPVGFWLQDHVDEGKRELNFSQFATYKDKRKKHKFEEIAEQVREKEMPLSSYTLIHRDAVLSAEEARLIEQWASAEFEKITPVPAP